MPHAPGQSTGPSPEPAGSWSPLTSGELAQWRGFVQWSEAVIARASRALLEGSGVSRTEFSVLVQLSEVDGCMQQSGLQDSLGWSASRLSHLLHRMEARGLLSRRDVGRGRAVYVELSQAGCDAAARAAVVHAAVVRDIFLAAIPEPVAEFFLREDLPRAAELLSKDSGLAVQVSDAKRHCGRASQAKGSATASPCSRASRVPESGGNRRH